jgi:hypothetical protein
MHGNNKSSIRDSPVVQWISESGQLSDNANRPDLLDFENFYRVFPGTQYSTIDASSMAPLSPKPSLNAARSEVRQHAFVMWHGLMVNLAVFVLLGVSSLLMPIPIIV